jgi:hypothetical protein
MSNLPDYLLCKNFMNLCIAYLAGWMAFMDGIRRRLWSKNQASRCYVCQLFNQSNLTPKAKENI